MPNFLQPISKLLEEAGLPATTLWLTGYAAAIFTVVTLAVWRALAWRKARRAAWLAKTLAGWEKRHGESYEAYQAKNDELSKRREAEMEARLRRAAQEHARVDFSNLQTIAKESVFDGYGAKEVAERYRALGLPYDNASQKLYEDGLRRAPIDNLIVALFIIWVTVNYLMLVLATILPYENVPLFEFSFYWLEAAAGAFSPGGIIVGFLVLFVYVFIAMAVVLPAQTKSIPGYIFAACVSVLASFLPSVVYDWYSRAILSDGYGSSSSSGSCQAALESCLQGPESTWGSCRSTYLSCR
jgi:hypothetical protein